MKEEEFNKKYKLISRDFPIYELVEEVEDNESEEYIVIDNELYSKKWEN